MFEVSNVTINLAHGGEIEDKGREGESAAHAVVRLICEQPEMSSFVLTAVKVGDNSRDDAGRQHVFKQLLLNAIERMDTDQMTRLFMLMVHLATNVDGEDKAQAANRQKAIMMTAEHEVTPAREDDVMAKRLAALAKVLNYIEYAERENRFEVPDNHIIHAVREVWNLYYSLTKQDAVA